MGRDKARSKGSFSQARTQKETLAEDAETENPGESPLTACRLSLSSILLHWEPVFPPSEPQQVQPGDKLDPSQLASDAAHLLTKWSLRCLVEASYDENRTKSFLRWVETAVIKHREISDVLLLDPGLKADLLRLYHRAFEAHCDSSVLARVETFQRFTNIMICLLEAQGHLPDLHQAVVSACLPEATQDSSRCGKSLPNNTTPVYRVTSTAYN